MSVYSGDVYSSMIEKVFMLRSWHYNLEDIEKAICENAGPCQMRLLLPQVNYRVMEGKWMAQLDVIKFLDWYIETAPTAYGYHINGIIKAVKGDIKKSRAVARKYRWNIAYRQGYRCSPSFNPACSIMLHPQAFEIDHMQELRDGGLDELKNLCALCSNCHAMKTRTHNMKYK